MQRTRKSRKEGNASIRASERQTKMNVDPLKGGYGGYQNGINKKKLPYGALIVTE